MIVSGWIEGRLLVVHLEKDLLGVHIAAGHRVSQIND